MCQFQDMAAWSDVGGNNPETRRVKFFREFAAALIGLAIKAET